MAVCLFAHPSVVQRFLLTSERFLLSGSCFNQSAKKPNQCVPSLRTGMPVEFGSEWIDPPQYRIDRHSRRDQTPLMPEVQL